MGKSLYANTIIYTLRSVLKIIFPLATYPYISRILGAEGIGKYNFSHSFVHYFVIIAALGISSYAVREGSRYRNNNIKLNEFASEVFEINIISCFVSYCLLFLFLLFNNNFNSHRGLILLLSSVIFLDTINLEWVYTIEEDYIYITYRAIAVYVISLILMFLLVRTENDVYNYAIVTVVARGGTSVFSWFYAKKYCRFHFVSFSRLLKHLKPIFTLFFVSLTITIYSSIDMTMLGLMKGDVEVGVYTIPVKIYDIVKSVIASVLLVMIPRASFLIGTGDIEGFRNVAQKVQSSLVSLATPAMVGLILLSEEIILLIAGGQYIAGKNALIMLSITILPNVISWFWLQCVLIPYKEEKYTLISAIITLIVNIVLNIFLIPKGGCTAAAFTTLVAEIVNMAILISYGRKHIRIGISNILFKVLGGAAGLTVVVLLIKNIFNNSFLIVCFSVVAGGLTYIIIEYLLKNEYLINLVGFMVRKVKSLLVR